MLIFLSDGNLIFTILAFYNSLLTYFYMLLQVRAVYALSTEDTLNIIMIHTYGHGHVTVFANIIICIV
jgi:hypothetical protein